MRVLIPGLLVVVLLEGPLTAEQTSTSASDILTDSGVQGGLVVHVGCGDGRLITELTDQGCFLVQGLDTDPVNVQRARALARSRGLSGRVSTRLFDGEHLPFIDNMVNLLIVESAYDIPREELLRVLTPRGVVVFQAAVSTPHRDLFFL